MQNLLMNKVIPLIRGLSFDGEKGRFIKYERNPEKVSKISQYIGHPARENKIIYPPLFTGISTDNERVAEKKESYFRKISEDYKRYLNQYHHDPRVIVLNKGTVLFSGYFFCTKHVSKVMAWQNKSNADYITDIIQINLKSGLEGSNKNCAYAGSKFAGPTDTQFSSFVNFYNIHYISTHFVGSSGGNTDDLIESLEMMEKNQINPAAMITHIGGLNCVVDTTLNLPKIHGGKKLIYTNIKMDLTALSDIPQKGKRDPFMAKLAEILSDHHGLCSPQAEKYLLNYAQSI